MAAPIPRLRPLDAVPIEVEGRQLIHVRDPLQYATESILVPEVAYYVMTLLDGSRSVIDVQESFARQFGAVLTTREILELVEALDGHHFLESGRFAARREEVEAAFRGATERPPAHAGSSYPADATALRHHLDGFFADLPPAPALDGPVRGVIAPHIDLRVGGTAYGHAYRALGDLAGPCRFVVLGTSHYGGDTRFVATRKDFATPLGTVPTDRDFLARLGRRVTADLYHDEPLHRVEHAVEFQVVLLQHVLGARTPFTVVPILVTSLHDLIATRRDPASEPGVAGVLDALRATLADDDVPTVLIAGVDFAHVGRKFGDPQGLAADLMATTEEKDRRLIAALEATDADAFFREIVADGDRTRICGCAPMYAFLSLVGGARGQLLHYERTREEATDSTVSYASLAYTAAG